MKHTRTSRHGLALVVVIWAIAICGVLASSLMVFSNRQALMGTEVQDRITARWAARSGIEATIATMAELSIFPEPDHALMLYYELESKDVATGEVGRGAWKISHYADNTEWGGPMDEHAKLNVNDSEVRGYIALLFYPLSFGVLDSITDWLDEDDEPSALGVERDYYQSLESRYEPRNGPIWHVAEMELIAGIKSEQIRGEDWNFNARLDLNEDDGDLTLPPDEPDHQFDGGWAEFLTARTTGGGPTHSGQPRLWLKASDPLEIQLRLGLTIEQAQSLAAKALDAEFKISDLVLENMPAELIQRSRFSSANEAPALPEFSPDEVTAILGEVGVNPAHRPGWGRININTVPAKMLYKMFEDEPRIVDDLLSMRKDKSEGIFSLMDLWHLPNMTEDRMAQLVRLFDTQSNIFTITSRGKSGGSGQEVEIIAVVDRSTVPITIIEYRED